MTSSRTDGAPPDLPPVPALLRDCYLAAGNDHLLFIDNLLTVCLTAAGRAAVRAASTPTSVRTPEWTRLCAIAASTVALADGRRPAGPLGALLLSGAPEIRIAVALRRVDVALLSAALPAYGGYPLPTAELLAEGVHATAVLRAEPALSAAVRQFAAAAADFLTRHPTCTAVLPDGWPQGLTVADNQMVRASFAAAMGAAAALQARSLVAFLPTVRGPLRPAPAAAARLAGRHLPFSTADVQVEIARWAWLLAELRTPGRLDLTALTDYLTLMADPELADAHNDIAALAVAERYAYFGEWGWPHGGHGPSEMPPSARTWHDSLTARPCPAGPVGAAITALPAPTAS